MKRAIITAIAIFLFAGCVKDKYFDGPGYYHDDFESYSYSDELLYPEDEHWSFRQLTRNENRQTLDTTHFHEGHTSLKFIALRSEEDKVSKSSISKQNMAFREGETLRMSGWYYIEGTQSLDWLFLMDMEEQTAVGAGPGMRLALVDNALRVEYKFNEDDIIQPSGQEIYFPRNTWVEIVWEVKLSQKKKGSVRLWQNGQLIIESEGNRTLPRDILYFQQGTKGMYSSCEIGVTANSRENDVTLWVDDITFERVD